MVAERKNLRKSFNVVSIKYNYSTNMSCLAHPPPPAPLADPPPPPPPPPPPLILSKGLQHQSIKKALEGHL